MIMNIIVIFICKSVFLPFLFVSPPSFSRQSFTTLNRTPHKTFISSSLSVSFYLLKDMETMSLTEDLVVVPVGPSKGL